MRSSVSLLLIAGIFFLAVAGAGIFVWTLALVGLVWTAGVLVWAHRMPKARAGELLPGPTVRGAFAGILGFLLLTLVPLPAWLSGWPGSERVRQNLRVAEVLREAAAVEPAAGGAACFAVTRNHAGTLRMAALALAVFAAGALSACIPARGRRPYVRVLTALGVVLAVLGWVGRWRLPQGDTLLWFIPIPHVRPGPMACFINRNHFAGFLAILSPAALALLIEDLRNRKWMGALLSVISFGLMVVGLLASLSRGGFLALLCGVAATLATAFLIRRRFPAVAVAALAFLLLVGLVIRFSPAVQDRLASLADIRGSHSYATRANAWRDTLKIWRAYPLAGVGANAFRTVYPQFRGTSAREYSTHAANDYAQLPAECGVAGLGLAAWLALALAPMARRKRAPGDEDPVPGLALCGALTAGAAHALVDFPLYVPLYAVVLSSLIGLRLGQAERPLDSIVPGTRAASAYLGLAFAFLLLSGPMQRFDSPAYLRQAGVRSLRRALIWAPTSWHAWYNLGRRLYAPDDEARTALAARCLSQAAACDPNNYKLWLAVGHFRLSFRDYAGAREAFARVKQLRAWVQVPPVPTQPPPQ